MCGGWNRPGPACVSQGHPPYSRHSFDALSCPRQEILVRTATRYHLGFLFHRPLPTGEGRSCTASAGLTSRPSGGRSDNSVVGQGDLSHAAAPLRAATGRVPYTSTLKGGALGKCSAAGPAGRDREGDSDVCPARSGRPGQGGVRLGLDEREGGRVLDRAWRSTARRGSDGRHGRPVPRTAPGRGSRGSPVEDRAGGCDLPFFERYAIRGKRLFSGRRGTPAGRAGRGAPCQERKRPPGA